MQDKDEQSTSTKHRIFISYSRRDTDAAQSLARFCKEKGAEPWSGWELSTGENWQEKLEDALQQVNIVVVLVSNEAQYDTSWQSRELMSICEQKWNKPDLLIVPIRLDEAKVPAFLSGLKALDGSNKTKLAECVEDIAHYRAMPSDRGVRFFNEEQRKEVENRFRELSEALSSTTTASENSSVEESGDE